MGNVAPEDCGEAAMLFWEPQRWRAEQKRRLAAHIDHSSGSGLYRSMDLRGALAGCGTDDADTASILRRLPVTAKDQLAAAGADAWRIGDGGVGEWVTTSGTLGRPLDAPLSARDLERLAANEAAALGMAGVARGDVLVLGVGMDRLFVAGLAYWLGGQKLGATCIRLGPQISAPGMLDGICERFGKNSRVFVVTVPSFLPARESSGTPPAPAGIIGIGEALRNADLTPNALGMRLRQTFGCAVMSTYASTETCTTFAEGPACIGGHLHPGLACVEILDDAGHEVAPGEIGEVLVTPLGVQAMPLLRFRTGDMAALFDGACPCGRTTPRLGPIVGRRQHLLKVRGTSVYPLAIIEALRSIDEIADCVVIAEREESGSDRVTVWVDGKGEPGAIRQRAQRHLAGVLRVTPEVQIVSAAALGELQRSAGARKIQRFIDRRGPDAASRIPAPKLTSGPAASPD